jgi:hypothetical protein
MNRIDRGAFLKLSLTLAGGSAVALAGCSDDAEESPGGAGGTGSGGTGNGMCTRDAQLTHTSGNAHDHLPLTTMITTTLLNGASFMFALPNDSGHIHTLTFTEQDLTNLRAGMTIPKTTSSDGGHTHTYDVKCV